MASAHLSVRDEAHLRTLPDGTVISWLRIPGDRTSEAVAFLRREVDPETGVSVWVSPGGWDPQSIRQAGVTFPCTVVRLGEFTQDQYLGCEIPALTETLTEFGGGTYARDKALECAATIYQGRGFTSDGRAREMGELVTSLAYVFELWLEREDLAEVDDENDLEGNTLALADCGLGDDESSDPPGAPGDVLVGDDRGLRAFHAWEDRDRAAEGEPTAIVRGTDQ